MDQGKCDSAQRKRVLFHGTERDLGLCYAAGKSGSIMMAYAEFKGEREALNLEGCVGLGHQTEVDLEELQRLLIMTDIPDSQGGCITLSRGWSDKEKQELLTEEGCEAWFAPDDWEQGSTLTCSP